MIGTAIGSISKTTGIDECGNKAVLRCFPKNILKFIFSFTTFKNFCYNNLNVMPVDKKLLLFSISAILFYQKNGTSYIKLY